MKIVKTEKEILWYVNFQSIWITSSINSFKSDHSLCDQQSHGLQNIPRHSTHTASLISHR